MTIGKVDTHVSLELGAGIEPFATAVKDARIWPLATVNAFMATQVARCIEALETAVVVTLVGFQARMDPHVTAQRKRPWKLFATVDVRANKDLLRTSAFQVDCVNACSCHWLWR